MPELKRNFTSMRMNKDVDERLVPAGEYRDALNIEISASESSDVGAIESSKGNSKITASSVLDGYTTPKCVGAVKDSANNKLYWFVTSDNKDVILEFDVDTNVVSPVIVCVKATSDALQFSNSYLITGANVIGGLLFWTDNNSEPKKINIDRFKAACAGDYDSHTQIYGGNVVEEHITVIKKFPKVAPNLVISNTLRADSVDATYQDVNGDTFVDTDGSTTPKAIGSEITLEIVGRPDYKENDILKFVASDINETYIARCSIKEITNQTSSSITIIAILLSTTEEMLSVDKQLWNVELEEGESFFQDKFPRFAYRWKYNDGEYSAFSPFTNVAFVPDDETFVYNMDEGHNVNMVNDVRKITLNTFDTIPSDVDEVDILYKESNSPSVYVVTTLRNSETSLSITSEQIEKLIESNQILRPYDNVPRKAKAQEIVGNRLLYGNYLQNYNFKSNVTIKLKNIPEEVFVSDPQPSAKSLRTYQAGVVYLDTYGRQSPVFTNTSASYYIDGTNSEKKNVLKAKITSDAPSWATHYKYYIKENSTPYYNVIMDRYYDGEANNFWLSFPSSERNKVDLDTYLILKKQNAKNTPFNPDDYGVKSKKYKVLDILPSVPDFITKKKTLIGKLTHTTYIFPNTTVGHPREGFRTFRIAGDVIGIDESELRDVVSNDNLPDQNKYLRITTEDGLKATNYYQIEKVTKFAAGDDGIYSASDDYFEFTFVKPLGADTNWLGTKDVRVDNLKVEMYSEENISQNEEFAGRFFVKLRRDDIITENIFGASIDEFDCVAETKFKLIDFIDTKAATKTLTSHQLNVSSGSAFAWYQDNADKLMHQNAGFCIEHDLDYQGNKPSGVYAGGTTAFNYDNKEPYAFTTTAVGPKKGGTKLTLRYIDYGDEGRNKDTNSPQQIEFNARDANNEKTTTQEDFNFHQILKNKKNLFISFSGDPKEQKIKVRDIDIRAGKNYNPVRKKRNSENRCVRYILSLDTPLTWSPLHLVTGGTDGGNLRVDYPGSPGKNQYKPIRKRNTESIKLWQKRVSYNDKDTNNPAVWETEPKEQVVDLDLYYEASDTYTISDHGTEQTLGTNRNGSKIWFNCFSFGNGVESDRVRDDFNGIIIDKGAIASTILDEPYAEERRSGSMIYSGVFNSKSGVNKLNQFIQAEKITKDINNSYGSIQKLHTRDNDVTVFCEDKVLKVLAQKDALYNADGNPQLISTNLVLGQAIPYMGDFGISTNPESFADYGYRSYFADKDRGGVLRLSMDGLTPISNKGMSDYFEDNLKLSTTVIGNYDEDKSSYNITLNDKTASFKENVDGWTSRKSFIPEWGISLNNIYYTFKNGDLYEHTNDVNKNTFYGTAYNSTVDLIFNDESGSIKKFKTLNYEGDSGWIADELTTDQETGGNVSFTAKENKYFAYLKHDKKYKITVSVTNSDGGNIILPDSQITKKDFGAVANETLTFIVKPKTGYTFSSVLTFGSYTAAVLTGPSASINSDGNMVITVAFNTFKMPASDITVELPLVTSGKVSQQAYALGGTYNKTLENAIISDYETGGLINSAGANGTTWSTDGDSNSTITLFNAIVQPNVNYAFSGDNLPQLVVTGFLNDNYQITGPTAIGDGYSFKVVGSIVNRNLTTENIKIHAKPGRSVTLSTNAIWGGNIDETYISKDEQERDITIYGSENAQVYIQSSAASSAGTDLAIDILDGNGFGASKKTLTIGSDGTVKARIKITANGTGANRSIYVLLTEVSGYIITDEFDSSDGSSNDQVLFTLTQTNLVALTHTLLNLPANSEIFTVTTLIENLSLGKATTDPMNSLANVEDPEDNNIGRMGFAIARIAPDTTSKVVKVDDLDVTNDFLNSAGANPYDATTGYLILTNGTQLDIGDATYPAAGASGRGRLTVNFEVKKYGSADDVVKLKTTNVLELSNNVGGSSGNIADVTLAGAGSFINSAIAELQGSTAVSWADEAKIVFEYEVTFLAAANGYYPSNFAVAYSSFTGGQLINDGSDATVALKEGYGDKFGRIRTGDIGVAVFRGEADGAIATSTSESATVTLTLHT